MPYESKNRTYQIVLGRSHLTKYHFNWDEVGEILHVKDTGEEMTFSIFHAINANPLEFVCCLRTQFEETFGFKLPKTKFRIFLYSHDGFVQEFTEAISPIDYWDFEYIHLPYTRKKERKRAYIE